MFWRQHCVSGLFWEAAKIDKIAEFVESFAFQADFWPITKHEKTLFLSTASCFRPVLRGCEIDKITEFDESFAFQVGFDQSKPWKSWFCRQHRVSGVFWQGAGVIKCENLMRASRFRLISVCQNVQKAMILSTVSCFRRVLAGCMREKVWECDESFSFQAHFGTPERI